MALRGPPARTVGSDSNAAASGGLPTPRSKGWKPRARARSGARRRARRGAGSARESDLPAQPASRCQGTEASRWLRSGSWSFLDRPVPRHPVPFLWKPDVKHRGAIVAGQLEPPAVGADDLLHDVQPQVSARPCPARRRVEQLLAKPIRDRLTSVGHGEYRFIPQVDDRDDHRFARGAVAKRVGEKVAHYLEQTVAVPLSRGIVIAFEFNRMAGVCERRFLDGLPANRRQGDRFSIEHQLARAAVGRTHDL